MKRLLIVGTSGAGKSTLARAVAERLSLPFIASDEYWWEPDWTAAGDEAVQARVIEIAARDAWVVESNFDDYRNLLWPRAELIVWLDFGRLIVFSRVARRNLAWALRRERVWAGNRMTFTRAWSGINHSMSSFSDKRLYYPRWLAEYAPNHLRFRRPRQADEWLRGLPQVER